MYNCYKLIFYSVNILHLLVLLFIINYWKSIKGNNGDILMSKVIKIVSDRVSGLRRMFQKSALKVLERTSHVEELSPAQQARKNQVVDYLLQLGQKRGKDLDKKLYDFSGYVDSDTPIGKFVAECGDDLAVIDKKYGLVGLNSWIQQADQQYAGFPITLLMSKHLLKHCSNGNSVNVKNIYSYFGELGRAQLEGYPFSLYVNGRSRITLTKEGQDALSVLLPAERFNFAKGVHVSVVG